MKGSLEVKDDCLYGSHLTLALVLWSRSYWIPVSDLEELKHRKLDAVHTSHVDKHTMFIYLLLKVIIRCQMGRDNLPCIFNTRNQEVVLNMYEDGKFILRSL